MAVEQHIRPDDLDDLRQARLLLLLAVGGTLRRAEGFDLERIGYYDFFAANPFLIFTEDSTERRQLVLAGWDSRSLSYQSAPQRFANRRARLQYDLARMVGLGIARVGVTDGRIAYSLTDMGREVAHDFDSLYATAYRTSAALVLQHLVRLSPTALRERATRWLKENPLIIDLYDDV